MRPVIANYLIMRPLHPPRYWRSSSSLPLESYGFQSVVLLQKCFLYH